MKIVYVAITALYLIVQQGYCSFESIQSVGGRINDIEIIQKTGDEAKTFAYIAQGANILVYDITNLANPLPIETISTGMEIIHNLALDGNYLAASAGAKGTLIYNLDWPEHPMDLNAIANYSSDWVDLFGSILIVNENKFRGGGPTSQYELQAFFDISDPANPKEIYRFNTGITSGFGTLSFKPILARTNPLVLIGQYPGFLQYIKRFTLQEDDNHNFTVTRDDLPSSEPRILFSNGYYGYVTLNDCFSVYNLTDMKNIEKIASIPLAEISGDAFCDGDYAYQPIHDNRQLSVIDLSQPAQPVEIGRIDVPFVPQGAKHGIGYSIDSNREIRLTTLSMQHPNESSRIQRTVISHDAVKAQNDWLVTGTVSSPSTRPEDPATASIISIYSIQNAGRLTEIARFSIQGLSKVIYIEFPLLAITTERDIQIYDITDFQTISLQSSFPWNEENRYVDYVETDSYFLFHKNHFYFRMRELKEPWGQYWNCYSLADPKKPVNLGKIAFPWEIRNRIQKGSIVYYMDESNLNLCILDLNEPERPMERGAFYTFAYDYDSRFSFCIDKNRLYVARFSRGKKNRIYVFDIAQPTQPAYIADFNLPFARSTWSALAAIWVDREKLVAIGSSDDPAFQFYYPFQPVYLYDISDLSNPIEIDYAITDVGTNGPLIPAQDQLILMPPSFGYYVLPLSNQPSFINDWQTMK